MLGATECEGVDGAGRARLPGLDAAAVVGATCGVAVEAAELAASSSESICGGGIAGVESARFPSERAATGAACGFECVATEPT